jgi:hypothetical protein
MRRKLVLKLALPLLWFYRSSSVLSLILYRSSSVLSLILYRASSARYPCGIMRPDSAASASAHCAEHIRAQPDLCVSSPGSVCVIAHHASRLCCVRALSSPVSRHRLSTGTKLCGIMRPDSAASAAQRADADANVLPGECSPQ